MSSPPLDVPGWRCLSARAKWQGQKGWYAALFDVRNNCRPLGWAELSIDILSWLRPMSRTRRPVMLETSSGVLVNLTRHVACCLTNPVPEVNTSVACKQKVTPDHSGEASTPAEQGYAPAATDSFHTGSGTAAAGCCHPAAWHSMIDSWFADERIGKILKKARGNPMQHLLGPAGSTNMQRRPVTHAVH